MGGESVPGVKEDLLYLAAKLARLEVEVAEARAVAISAAQALHGIAGSPHTAAIADVLLRRYEWLRGAGGGQ